MKKIFLLMFAAAAALGSWATDEVTATFTSNKLDVALTNSTEFVAFQMDITLDASVTVSDLAKTGRLATGESVTIAGELQSTEFQLLSNKISEADGKQTIRVIAYNLGNNAITDVTGSIFTATLSAEPTAVSIDNILFVDREGLAEAQLAAAKAEAAGEISFDFNGDGSFTITDVSDLLSLLVSDGAYDLRKVDFDGNGVFTIGDVSALIGEFVKN